MRRVAFTILLLLGAQGASAGTELATETRSPAAGDRVRKATAFFDGPRMRIDADDGRRTIVYRGDRETVWIIDHKKANYIEFERPTAAALASQAQAQLDRLAPEQRAAVDGAIDVAAGAEVPGIEVRETGVRDRIHGIPCKEVELSRDDQRIADACWASYADAGVAPGSFDAVREVQALLQDSVAGLIPGKLRRDGLALLDSFGQLDGVPLRARSYRQGQLETETLVTRIESKPLPESNFGIPKGYKPRIVINIGK
jgi:hypothetical protein